MRHCCFLPWRSPINKFTWISSPPPQNKWISRSPMLQRRVYHSMAAVQRKLYVLGGNDLDYNNDRILVRHIDSYNIDTDQWTRCSFNLLTGKYLWLSKSGKAEIQEIATLFLSIFHASLNIKCMVTEQLVFINQKGAHYLSHKMWLSQVAELVSQGLCYLRASSHLAGRGMSVLSCQWIFT